MQYTVLVYSLFVYSIDFLKYDQIYNISHREMYIYCMKVSPNNVTPPPLSFQDVFLEESCFKLVLTKLVLTTSSEATLRSGIKIIMT